MGVAIEQEFEYEYGALGLKVKDRFLRARFKPLLYIYEHMALRRVAETNISEPAKRLCAESSTLGR